MEFRTKHGHVLDIQSISDQLYQEAARAVDYRKSPDAPLANDVEFGAELARVAILSWKTESGEEPLKDKKPGEARVVIKRTVGLSEYVLAKSKLVKQDEAAGFEVEKGN